MINTPTITERKSDSKADVEGLLIGNSAPMAALREMVRRVARSHASVMICGPSGSGKEVVARAIHAASPRAAQPYIALNTGAIPAELIESELFGHEKGAFTGAQNRRVGHFENADRGTLFLDEIGDMRFDMQVKLLRVLEDGMVNRVGGNVALPVDVRIISATHQNLETAIVEGRFREDLFFRLGVVLLQVPSLADRVEDIPQLIAHFQKGRSIAASCQFGAAAMQRLMMHSWPGNVRELRNVVERGSVLFPGEIIDAFGVDQLLGRTPPKPQPVRPDQAIDIAIAEPADGPIDLKAQIERIELERIRVALERAEGVISEAARMLTLKRTTLIEKMRKYGVERLAA
ncbi:MAG: sigma-54-dependent Fis family transcriptional regulator [Sphingomonadaceae bacterium]|nr:sigma-54-dependent Fis family transcriptional regulator [Sphingomonadaceae bacterium]